jgi:hypothetical protein
MSPDANGQCSNQCPADVVVNGMTDPLAITTSPTGASGLAPGTDSCPGLFVLEIQSPDAFITREAGGPDVIPRIGASLSVPSPSQPTCNQSFLLSLFDTGVSGFVSVQQSAVVGSFSPGGNSGGLGVPPSCGTLPAITLKSADIPAGSPPIRFVTPVLAGVSFTLNTEPGMLVH